jgi:mRNA-degrading endonuclease toxin of MazEF toxin-antitoxin module
MPGNVLVERGVAGMRENSVVNVAQLFTLDRSDLLELWGRLPNDKLEKLNEGLAQVIGLE